MTSWSVYLREGETLPSRTIDVTGQGIRDSGDMGPFQVERITESWRVRERYTHGSPSMMTYEVRVDGHRTGVPGIFEVRYNSGWIPDVTPHYSSADPSVRALLLGPEGLSRTPVRVSQ